jgi:hypothetical protein
MDFSSISSLSSLGSLSSGTFKYGVVYYALPEGSDPGLVERLRALWRVTTPRSVKDIKWEVYDGLTDEPKLIARRANIGNIGRRASIELTVDPNASEQVLSMALARFARTLTDITSINRGDVLLTSRAFDDEVLFREEASPVLSGRADIDYSTEPEDDVQFINVPTAASETVTGLNRYIPRAKAKRDTQEDKIAKKRRAEENRLIDEDLRQKEQQRRLDFDQLRAQALKFMIEYQADPAELLKELLNGKYIIQEDGLSPLVINENLDICLPNYNEMVIDMPPLCKAIYILFLKHSEEGIRLVNFGDYRDEFEEIYNCVMPNRDEKLARQSIDDLCDPSSNSLNEKKSRIKRYFKNKILDDNIARQYYITGPKSGPNRITLPPDMITLPAYFG